MSLSLEKVTQDVRKTVNTFLNGDIADLDQDIGKDLDELDRQELYMELEEVFNILIHDPDLEKSTITVKSIAQYIYKQLKP